MIFINDIPFYFVLIYGAIETMVLSWFVLEMSNIDFSINHLIKISCFRLLLILLIRNIFPGNVTVITLSSVFLGIFITWAILHKCNIRIVIFSFISVLITNLIEILSGAFAERYLQSLGDYINWWLTGIPHILLLILIPVFVKKGKLSCKEKGDTLEMQ